MPMIPVGVSARHIHLCSADLHHLFGDGYELTVFKELSQPGQFAAQETVILVGPKGQLEKVRILGPLRPQTQIEISRTDAFSLGVHPPVRESGHIVETPGLQVIGPKGDVNLQQGVIVAARHIHFHTSDAERWGIQDKQMLRVHLQGERPLILENVVARVSNQFALDMHIDTDEGNAAGVKTGDQAELIIES